MGLSKSLKLFVRLFVYLLSGSLAGYIFYSQAYGGLWTDLGLHVDRILPIVNGEYFFPHPLFHYIVYFIQKISIILNVNWSLLDISIVFLSLLFVVIFDIIYRIAVYFHIDNYTQFSLLLISLSLLFITPIYLPIFNTNLYLGQWGPNTWHSPTIFIIKPFTLICLFFMVKLSQGKEWYNKSGILVLFSLFMALSAFAKPSFVISFAPATIIFLLVYYWKNFKLYFKIFILFLPTIAVLIYQYIATYSNDIASTADMKDEIIFTFFGVMKYYTPNFGISLILATAFPLFLFIIDLKNCLKNHYLMLSFFNVIISFTFASFLAEKFKFEQGAFLFGYILSLFLLFVFSLFHFLKFIKSDALIKFKEAKVIFLLLIYFLHLYSGCFYFFRYLLTQSYA